MLFCTCSKKNKIFHINITFAKITKSIIEEKKIIAIFYDSEKRLVKTLHFGAAGYLEYTISPHKDKRNKINIKRHTNTGTTT